MKTQRKLNICFTYLPVLVLVLCSCTSGAPTPIATVLSASTTVPTLSPTLTLTLIPIPSATSVPTKGLSPEVLLKQINEADSMYKSGEFKKALGIYTELLTYGPDPRLYALRAETFDRLGDFNAAIADYLAAVDLGEKNDLVLNNLCWDMGITGQAEKALPYCEEAVKADPSSSKRDSRGVVYAQLGKFPEATADFQAVVDDLKGTTDPGLKAIATERQEWISSLQSKVNPITPEVLAKLRADTSAVAVAATPVPGPNAISRSSVQNAATKLGFKFGEVDGSGNEETLTGNLVKGSCNAVIQLVGPETDLTSVLLQATGCSDKDQAGFTTWLIMILVPEKYAMDALTYASSMDIYNLIEGQVGTTGEVEIGNVIYETKRSADSKQTLEITAHFKE